MLLNSNGMTPNGGKHSEAACSSAGLLPHRSLRALAHGANRGSNRGVMMAVVLRMYCPMAAAAEEEQTLVFLNHAVLPYPLPHRLTLSALSFPIDSPKVFELSASPAARRVGAHEDPNFSDDISNLAE